VKKTFSLRKIDNLGRIVIPMDIRRALEIKEWDELRISMEGDHIVVAKASPMCIFCQSSEDLISYQDKFVCKRCAENFADQV